MIHAAIAAAMAIALGYFDCWLALLPAVFFFGREVGQAERRYLSKHNASYNKSPWYCGFLPEAWNKKSVLDFVLPLLACLAIGGAYYAFH